MGIKSTYDIERELAINIILNKINECSNEQLSNILEEFNESYFRNYKVYNYLPNEFSDRAIKTFSEF